jgi:hypothetical protein
MVEQNFAVLLLAAAKRDREVIGTSSTTGGDINYRQENPDRCEMAHRHGCPR